MIKSFLISVLFSLSVYNGYCQEGFNITKWVENISETVVDLDGNVYHIQKIGNQLWLKENLKVTKFNNGHEIKLVQEDSLWITLNSPSYSNLIGITNRFTGLDSSATNQILYNYYVVSDTQNVCPLGWKVPDTNDWNKLQKYMEKINKQFSSLLGSGYPPNYKDTIGEDKRMEMLWRKKYNVGFSSKPFGYRSGQSGEFKDYSDFGYWWSTHPKFIAIAWARIQNRGFGIDDVHLEEMKVDKRDGYSIKCIKE